MRTEQEVKIVSFEVGPKWPDRKIRVRERKTSDWDYERYFEVGSWEELMEYLKSKYWRWVIEFREKEPEPKLKSEEEYDVEVELYDTWRE